VDEFVFTGFDPRQQSQIPPMFVLGLNFLFGETQDGSF